MQQFLLDRFAERSSWRGLVDFAAAAGLVLQPEQAEAIIALGLAARALVGTFMSDRKPE